MSAASFVNHLHQCTMSSTSEPIPGDYIVALNVLRAWVSDTIRGWNHYHIQKGEQALVIQTWFVGNQVRLRVFRDGRILVFSCPQHALKNNWLISIHASRLPTSGSQ